MGKFSLNYINTGNVLNCSWGVFSIIAEVELSSSILSSSDSLLSTNIELPKSPTLTLRNTSVLAHHQILVQSKA